MVINNIYTELNRVEIDEKAGIKVTLVTGDEHISVFAAEIAPQTELKPHYHTSGIETYQILEGKGQMRIGELVNDEVKWIEIFDVAQGDCFSIPEMMVHQIINKTDASLKAIFTCRSAHLGEDRFFTE